MNCLYAVATKTQSLHLVIESDYKLEVVQQFAVLAVLPAVYILICDESVTLIHNEVQLLPKFSTAAVGSREHLLCVCMLWPSFGCVLDPQALWSDSLI